MVAIYLTSKASIVRPKSAKVAKLRIARGHEGDSRAGRLREDVTNLRADEQTREQVRDRRRRDAAEQEVGPDSEQGVEQPVRLRGSREAGVEGRERRGLASLPAKVVAVLTYANAAQLESHDIRGARCTTTFGS